MFEPESIHHNFIDLLGAPRRALRGKKIWTHLVGLVVGYGVFAILAYLALAVDGAAMSQAWNDYGLYPFIALGSSQLQSIPAMVIYALGALFWLATTLLASTVVARITYKELKGDPFYSSGDGWTYTKKHWRSVVFSPFVIIMIILFMLIMAAIMALIGKLPYLGEIVFLGLYPLYFMGSLFTLYTGAVLVVLVLYVPAIVALWEEDTMGSLAQAYSITWSQPWRLVVYAGLLAIMVLAGLYLSGLVVTAGYRFLNFVFGPEWLMGSDLDLMVAYAESFLFAGQNPALVPFPSPLLPSAALASNFDLGSLSGWQVFTGSALALLLLLLYASVVAYGLSIVSVGQALSFVIFKLRSDDEDLLQRKDEEELASEAEEQEEAKSVKLPAEGEQSAASETAAEDSDED